MGDQKTLVLTGASRGIGKGLVDVFHKAGWSVHATIRNTNVTFPSNVVTHLMDVENEEDIDFVIAFSGCKTYISNEECNNLYEIYAKLAEQF